MAGLMASSVEEGFDVDVVADAGGVVRDREFGHAVSVLGRRGGGQSVVNRKGCEKKVRCVFQLLSNLSNVWYCVCVWLLTCVLRSWAQATHFAFCNSLSTLVTWNHGFVGRRRFCYFGFGGDNTARSSTVTIFE